MKRQDEAVSAEKVLIDVASFFKNERDPAGSIDGDQWSSFRGVLDTERIDAIRTGIAPESDLEFANPLTRLVYEELRKYATDGSQRLSNDDIALVLRAHGRLLTRLGIAFKPPFRDFDSFHDYWSGEGMSGPGSWAERRRYLNKLFDPVWSRVRDLEDRDSSKDSLRGVDGELKNIIFASAGPKPEIVLRDAVNNVIEIVKNSEYCLVYDRPLLEDGLTWGDLVSWWSSPPRGAGCEADLARTLYRRLWVSLRGNDYEQRVFRAYCKRYSDPAGMSVPALIPQVYLHFDPFTAGERRRLGKPSRLNRERMDFLLLLPNRVRIVIEVDGKQHYADGETASPMRYSEMVAEDRALRLGGYEIFRFGGYELAQPDADTVLDHFFDSLLARYTVSASADAE